MRKHFSLIVAVFLILAVVCMAALDQVQLFGWNASDKTWDNVVLDPNTGTLLSITQEHHEVHEGTSFTVSVSNTVTNTGEHTAIGFATPNTDKWVHLFYYGTASALSKFSICETTSVDPNEGTETAIINRHRNSSVTSTVSDITGAGTGGIATINKVSYYDETAAAAANITETTEIYSETMGGSGNTQSKTGGQTRGRVEFILKQDTEYIILMTALDDNDNVQSIQLEWYEHTDH